MSTPFAHPETTVRPASVSAAALDLVALARRGLDDAAMTEPPGERYAAAHLAALRAAAAVLAVRARPGSSRGRRPTSAWALLTVAAPELGEWASFFAAGAAKRAAAEAGLTGAVSPRDADDLLRDVETFVELVESLLGIPHQSPLVTVAG